MPQPLVPLFAALALLVVAACSPSGAAEDPVVEEATEMAAPPPEPPSPEQQALDRDLARIGGAFPGHVGIAVRDLQNGETMHFNGLELFPQQSVSKLWVALTALDLIDRGKLSPDDTVAIGQNDLTLFHQPIEREVKRSGTFVTDVADLMERAITHSDNTANDALLRRVGGSDAVRAFLADHDLGSIRFGPGERAMQSAIAGLEWRQTYSRGKTFFDVRDEVPADVRTVAFEGYVADPVDGAAPVAVAAALARAADGDVVSRRSTEQFLELLAQVKSGPNRLKGGLPPGWGIGHKTGTGQYWNGVQSGYNDVGILTAPDGDRYAVAVMIARTSAPVPECMDMMHRVVAAIAAYDEAVDAREGDGKDAAAGA